MAIFDFFLSRNNGSSVNSYVGHNDRLFYDPVERVLRISNGSTPGGEIFNGYVNVSETQPTENFEGKFWFKPSTFELSTYHDGNYLPTIDLATETKIGGVKLGPGVVTNSEGQIIIDSTGLDFSFGDFEAIVGTYSDSTTYALLGSAYENEDIVLASTGTGKVSIVGEFTVHATDGSVTGSLETDPIFKISEDGQVMILVPDTDTSAGAVEIAGSSTGEIIAPGQPGTMLHLTGQIGEQCRFYIDGNGNYTSIVGRRWNGSISGGRTQVLANEDVLRINATAQTNTELPSQAIAQIAFTATENQTATTQGSSINFIVTPQGQPTANRVTGLSVTADTLTAIGVIVDSKGDVRSVPINGQSGAYNIASTDNGKMISITTGGVSVLQNVFASPYGQIVSIYNNSNTSQIITQGAGVTLRLAGTAATGNRTLARYGVATITCVAANTFVISGAGLT